MGLIKDSLSIQNASGHGIDLMIKDNNDKWVSFEVKTSVRKSQGRLDGRAKKPNQRDGADRFTKSRLERAREGNGHWAGNPDREAKAREILNEIGGAKVEGYVIHISLYHKKGQQVEFRSWVKGSPRGTAIPNASSK